MKVEEIMSGRIRRSGNRDDQDILYICMYEIMKEIKNFKIKN